MLKLRKVAITGGLSCGKSSVCRILKELGAYVVSADEIVHQLLSSDTNLGQKVIELLGTGILVNQAIDRSRVAQMVFQNDRLLDALEKIIHPAVYDEIEKQYQEQQDSKNRPSLFIAEIPLLFESDGEKGYDAVIAVIANSNRCFERFKQATGYDQEEFNNRLARQLPLLNKAVLADYVLMNNGTLSDLQQLTRELYQELIESD
ncbi:dephospho-CoA kinase [Candidatus Protochlamydia phocaeensis]|uniref:dephospho-CoA kinase n=1 Tax=Candidatus Protochlamydia phocaeensis TaxID=1414722 RepID=UPI000838E1BD|nr:dephospho-CoA kinase [Candidatus Protochlamydia phocaeensis]